MRYVGLTNAIARCPKCALVFIIPMTVLFSCLGVFSWQHAQTYPDKPESMSLDQALSQLENDDSRIWVVIPSVEWDCNNLIHDYEARSYDTDVIFTNPEHTIMGMANFSGKKTCDSIMQTELTGVISLMNETYLEKLPERGFDLSPYQNTTTFVEVCTHCGRYNSLSGAWIFGILAIITLSLYPLGLRMNRRYRLEGRLPYPHHY